MKKGMLTLMFAVFFLLYACTDDSYLIDTGLHNAKYNGTILEYLKSKPVDFDSLTKIIKLGDMEEVFDKEEVTFFAPSNPSINSTIRKLNEYLYARGRDTVKNLNQIDSKLWKEMLSMYIIKDKYLLKDIPQLDTTQLDAYRGQGFISYLGKPMNVGVVYFDAGGVKYAGYRQLYYSYINDFNNTPGSMLNVPVASSDIQPNNGVVHVLQFKNHDFSFKSTDFIFKAITEGIKEEEK